MGLADIAHRVRNALDPQPPDRQRPAVAASSSDSSVESLIVASALQTQNVSRDLAMTVPTIERARDILCGTIASLPLRYWARRPPGMDDSERSPEQWMFRPDPNRTLAHMLGWTVDDLIFHGRAFWLVKARYSNGFPAEFTWMPHAEVGVRTAEGRPWGDVVAFTWRGKDVNLEDVVSFDGLAPGLLYYGWRAIDIALSLDQAAQRFADATVPFGWLQQSPDQEPYSTAELIEVADMWHNRRLINATAALGAGMSYIEGQQNPERLQLVEARQHQALELARLMNVPPWVVGAPQGASMTYSNALQARLDLIDFGALPHVTVIEQTLSGPNVTPQGSYVTLDTDRWLRNPWLATPGGGGADGVAPYSDKTAGNGQAPEPAEEAPTP